MATWDTKEYGFGSSLNSPDYSGAFSSKKDGAFSNAWKTGFGVSGAKSQNNWGEIFGGLFDKAKETNKYRDEAKRPSFGESNRGSGGQLLENLSALYPQQHAPMFIPGETSQGIGRSNWWSDRYHWRRIDWWTRWRKNRRFNWWRNWQFLLIKNYFI
jgi:hypothetical protein